eukprot:3369138-Pyramimonas_sp.AAC.1
MNRAFLPFRIRVGNNSASLPTGPAHTTVSWNRSMTPCFPHRTPYFDSCPRVAVARSGTQTSQTEGDPVAGRRRQ